MFHEYAKPERVWAEGDDRRSDRDEDCKVIQRIGEATSCLFSFTFEIPIDEIYPIQEQ